MSISGIVIYVQPDSVDVMSKQIAALGGVDIHAATDDGRLVATVDQPDDRKAADVFTELQNMAGVLNTALVYTYFEPDPADKEHAQ